MARGTVLLLLAGAFAAALLPDAAESRILLTLHDFGAVGDGVADDTKAFADAWTAACTAADNVILNVPAGGTFQIWPLTLAGPCRSEIKLLISGDIVAPESPSDWGHGQRSQWLHFHKVQDLKITGGGIIDGRGQQWWAQSSLMRAQPAPKAVHFEDCQGISVKGITLQNSQSYHLTFTRSSDVEAKYLRVTSPEDSIDTKGIHLVDSFNVHVMDNLISTGDDCVSIVGKCEDVRLSAISCGPGHGISIGTLGVNNSVDYVEKIKVDTLFISNDENGVRVRTTKAAATAVQVEKINYIDITGTSASKHAVRFSCSDAKPCRHLSLVNVNLSRVDGNKASSCCRKAFGRSIGTVIPESRLSKEDFVQHDVPQRSEEDREEDSDS
ncbi:unnamed protein product [Miscanthus lutarioriparius]|uniref:Polygalacturonase n=1 Tax=Miscanthus lutarioriparius TaxID=422564 RepID=A0A811RWL5_9POAL|nr:unnamed protein product [Miscanthus lutarioriparius]